MRDLHHDYHLVNPSPWPAIGAVSAFVTAFGLILWMHHIVVFAPLIFGLGAGNGNGTRAESRWTWESPPDAAAA